MGLKNIRYNEDYRSGYDNLVDDFFRPSLREARRYCRAVGYFSSSALEAFGSPLGEFVRNQGDIRLVTSVELSEDDLEAIAGGAERSQICAERVERILDDEFVDGVGDGVIRLARLLQMGRLEIRIAVPRTGTGIYHEKIGLFDDGNDFVAFTGSSNESRNAFENNRECLDVYPSWTSSASRAQRKREHFEALWAGRDEGVELYSFPEAAAKKLLRACGEDDAVRLPWVPADDRWRHQNDAVRLFLNSERGVLKMATGTGKTRVALTVLQLLIERQLIDTVVISADGNDLLEQWYRQLLETRQTMRRPLTVFRQYGGNQQRQDFVLDPENAILLVSRGMLPPALSNMNRARAERTLLVHDEVHRLGSVGNLEHLRGLSDNVRFRLGLSATPERAYDEDGNEFIEEHIGPVIFDFGLEEAIQRGILAPFRYFPLPFEPTENDRARISHVWARRAAREAEGNPMTDTEFQIEIARVYKTSEAKRPVFEAFVAGNQDVLRRCIVFVETIEYGRSVLDLIHQHRADFHTYFSGEDSDTLRRFAAGDLECLITCHRLSEGIDIQSLNSVILFSSEKGRLETIQRLGRCLRTNPDEPGKVANVVDFIRESGDNEEATSDEERRDWLTELSRVRPQE